VFDFLHEVETGDVSLLVSRVVIDCRLLGPHLSAGLDLAAQGDPKAFAGFDHKQRAQPVKPLPPLEPLASRLEVIHNSVVHGGVLLFLFQQNLYTVFVAPAHHSIVDNGCDHCERIHKFSCEYIFMVDFALIPLLHFSEVKNSLFWSLLFKLQLPLNIVEK